MARWMLAVALVLLGLLGWITINDNFSWKQPTMASQVNELEQIPEGEYDGLRVSFYRHTSGCRFEGLLQVGATPIRRWNNMDIAKSDWRIPEKERIELKEQLQQVAGVIQVLDDPENDRVLLLKKAAEADWKTIKSQVVKVYRKVLGFSWTQETTSTSSCG